MDDSSNSLGLGSLGVSSIVAKFEKVHKENKLSDHSRRQVNYNVEVLHRMLQKVVAMRDTSYNPLALKLNKQHMDGFRALSIKTTKPGQIVLDEVKETVQLPKEALKYKQDPDKVVLSPEVSSQLRDFVTTIASLYRKNQFHCFEHAGHVIMSVTKLMSRLVTSDAIDYTDMSYKKKAGSTSLHRYTYGITSDPLTQFAIGFASLIHDVDHPGIPNSVLIQQDPELAKTYRSRCIAEQNAVDIAWNLLMESGYEDLRMCIYTNQAELDRFRVLVVNGVMATDLFDKDLVATRQRRWDMAFQAKKPGSKARRGSFFSEEDADRKAALIIEHLIQASDIAHTMQHWNIFLKWNKKLYQERYDAFKAGKTVKDPAEDWYDQELSFFDEVVIPLAQRLIDCGVFGAAGEEYLSYAVANRSDWVLKGRDVVQDFSGQFNRSAGRLPKGSVRSYKSSNRSLFNASRDGLQGSMSSVSWMYDK
jgi:hypothetical protein